MKGEVFLPAPAGKPFTNKTIVHVKGKAVIMKGEEVGRIYDVKYVRPNGVMVGVKWNERYSSMKNQKSCDRRGNRTV